MKGDFLRPRRRPRGEGGVMAGQQPLCVTCAHEEQPCCEYRYGLACGCFGVPHCSWGLYDWRDPRTKPVQHCEKYAKAGQEGDRG